MPDIFEYSPRLEYELDKVDTIDNIEDSAEDLAISLLKNRGSVAVTELDKAIQRIGSLLGVVGEKLKDEEVSFPVDKIDEITRFYLSDYSDSEILLEDGKITHSLYKYARGIAPLYEICYQWDMHHAGIDGRVEAELEKQLETVKDELLSAKELIEKTVNYDLPHNSLEELGEREILEIRSVGEYSKTLDRLYSDENTPMNEIHMVRKKQSKKNSSVRLRGSISKIALTMCKNAKSTIDMIEKRLSDKEDSAIREESTRQADLIKRKLSVNETGKKLVIYESFRTKMQAVTNKNQDVSNATSKKGESYKSMITNIRIFKDVVAPILEEMEYTQVDDLGFEGFQYMLEGAEEAVMRKQTAIMEFKNSSTATCELISKQTKGILEKDKVRILYKSL